VRFDRADGVTLPGEATTNGESPYSGLVGDSFLVQGLRLVNLVFSATLVGGDDLISLSGFAGLDATGDAHTANGYGRVTGGDDRIINQAEGDPLLFDREPMWLAGDVHRSYEFSTIDGGRDSIVGSDFAFYSDIVSGDVMFCGAIATASGGTINGGADKIEGRSGQDLLAGDVYESFGGVIRGGNDHLRGGEDSDLIAGDVLRAAGAMAITGGNDILHGDNGNDRMAGDLLTAGAIAAGDAVTGGNDVLYGGDGNDVIHGDLFFTGGLFGSVVGGDDRLDGGLGDDVLNGQDGSDTVMFSGLALAVVVDLAAGTATGQGTDRISGIENIIGSSRSDVLKGDIGTNQIIGGPGNDQVIGRDGNDTLSGGNGNDQIIGGRGADELTGSAGTDRFVFLRTPAGADVIDRIVDFQDGTDRLDLRDFGFAGFAAVRALAADTPGGLRLDLPGEEVVRIIGLTKAAFDAGDVLL
jgi:Ca2+-binding RTX toxin-like protein